MQYIDNLDYTIRAVRSLRDVVNHDYFSDRDADLIYKALERSVRLISFGDYLKRYIYRKNEMSVPFEEVPLEEYQRIIKESFAGNDTPVSFTPTSAKIGALSKNWLTQLSVRRKVVFLLGFGLGMSALDVEEFLKKGLREQGINPKDPFEVICWYCYRNGYSYPKYEELYDMYQNTSEDSPEIASLLSDYTIDVKKRMIALRDDASLMRYLTQLKSDDGNAKLSVSAGSNFLQLYNEARRLVAEIYNDTEEEIHAKETEEYRDRIDHSDRLTDHEKNERVAAYRNKVRKYAPEDITEKDIEGIICSAIPADRHGNLTPAKASSLNEQFLGKRFSRQRINDLLLKKAEVNRFDLITLNFFIFSQQLEEYAGRKARYTAFIRSTNHILNECCLGNLYIANPYENFILMCILSEDPLGTYADVWELSYSESSDSR